jgi:hypothetical protein
MERIFLMEDEQGRIAVHFKWGKGLYSQASKPRSCSATEPRFAATLELDLTLSSSFSGRKNHRCSEEDLKKLHYVSSCSGEQCDKSQRIWPRRDLYEERGRSGGTRHTLSVALPYRNFNIKAPPRTAPFDPSRCVVSHRIFRKSRRRWKFKQDLFRYGMYNSGRPVAVPTFPLGFKLNMLVSQITNLRFKSLNEISAQLNLNSKDPKVRLSPDDKLFRLDATHEVELGEVQPRTAEILRALSVPDISLQLFTAPKRTQKEWVRTQAKRKARTETFVSLSLIIYGSMELCESVGEFASECDIDLQDPTRPVRNVLYKNPHLLMEPEEPLVWTSTILNSTIVQEIDTVVSQEFLTTLLSAGFLPENDVLEPTEDPEQIRTQLMRYYSAGFENYSCADRIPSTDTRRKA